jgi:hypothetical protein
VSRGIVGAAATDWRQRRISTIGGLRHGLTAAPTPSARLRLRISILALCSAVLHMTVVDGWPDELACVARVQLRSRFFIHILSCLKNAISTASNCGQAIPLVE